MTAPTLLSYVESTWSGTASSETTATAATWNASGDRVIVLGITEDNGETINTPTATGLTFAALSGLPTNSASSCKGYGWSATATGSGSSTITASTSIGIAAGIAGWAFSGVNAIVVPTPVISAALTVTITVAQDSSVLLALGDWNATTDVTVDPTPGDGTVREATMVSGRASFYIAEWHNQAAGTRAYGLTNWTGTGTITKVPVEVQGVASAAASLVVPTRARLGALLDL